MDDVLTVLHVMGADDEFDYASLAQVPRSRGRRTLSLSGRAEEEIDRGENLISFEESGDDNGFADGGERDGRAGGEGMRRRPMAWGGEREQAREGSGVCVCVTPLS